MMYLLLERQFNLLTRGKCFVHHKEEALYPRFPPLNSVELDAHKLCLLLMKSPLLPSAFDHSLVLNFLRLEPLPIIC